MFRLPRHHNEPGFATRLTLGFIGLCLLAIPLVNANAQILDYGPYSGYGIRMGILGNDYTTPRAACITGTESSLPASKSGFRVSIVYNSDEYRSAFHVDQQAQASFLGIGSGGDELHIGRETGSSGSAFDIVVEAYGEHDSQTVDNIKWDARYQAMLDSGDPAQKQHVRQDCGDRYIKTVFYEVRLFAVLHVSSQQNSALTQFAGEANGSVNILDVGSAAAKLGGDVNVSSAHKAGAITVDIFSEGLGGTIPTAGALHIVTADGLNDIADKLAVYVSNLKETGQPVKYRLAPLPDMVTGNLSDVQIFRHLDDFKQQYVAANARVENIHSLLSPADPRRIILRQPSADIALRHQEDNLAALMDSVAEAHDRCRKATAVAECISAAHGVQTLPLASVELRPALFPNVLNFVFAIDGVPVPPGESTQLFAVPGKTLLEAARAIKADASNVDVLAPIIGADYLASISIPVRVAVLQPPPRPATLIAQRIVRIQDLSLPPYWKGPFTFNAPPVLTPSSSVNPYLPPFVNLQDPPVLHVIHSDALTPCRASQSGGLAYWEESCLTNSGRALRDAFLADVASNANNVPLLTYFDQLTPWMMTDCFGNLSADPFWIPVSPSPAGVLPIVDSFAFVSTAPGQVSAKASLLLPMKTAALPLFGIDEIHDAPTWAQLAQSRLATLVAANGVAGSGPNLCSARVP